MFFWIVGLLVLVTAAFLRAGAQVLILVFLDSGSSGSPSRTGPISAYRAVLILVFLDSGSSGILSVFTTLPLDGLNPCFSG